MAKRTAAWAGGAVWAGSWFMMYREITHWRHVKPNLAFNYDLGADAHPGLPLLLLYGVCAAAPVVTLAAAIGGVLPPGPVRSGRDRPRRRRAH